MVGLYSQDRQPTHDSLASLDAVDMQIDEDFAKMTLEMEPTNLALDAGGVPFAEPLDPFPATQPDPSDRDEEKPKAPEDPA